MTDEHDFASIEEPHLKQYKERVPTEYRIQVATVNHIMGRKDHPKAFEAFATHCYQGRDEKEGFFLKELGVYPGVGDLLILWRDECQCGRKIPGVGFIEEKSPNGYKSPVQKKFHGICIWLGIKYEIARSVQQAHDIMVKWGIKAFHHSVVEPDLRSMDQKKKDAFDFYKPQK